MLVHPWFHHMFWLNEQNKHSQSDSRLAICGPEELLSVLKGSLLIENDNIKVQRIKKESRFTLTHSLCILQVKQTESTLWNAQVNMKKEEFVLPYEPFILTTNWEIFLSYCIQFRSSWPLVPGHNIVMIFYLFNIPLKKWETLVQHW